MGTKGVLGRPAPLRVPRSGVVVIPPGSRASSNVWWTQIPSRVTGGATSTQSLTAVYGFPVEIANPISWDALAVEAVGAVASSFVRVAIYDLEPWLAGSPARAVYLSGSMDTSTTGQKTDLTPGSIPAGLYAIATQSTGAASQIRGYQMGGDPVISSWNGNSSGPATTAQTMLGWQAASWTLGQPVPLTSVSGGLGSSNSVPVVFLRRP